MVPRTHRNVEHVIGALLPLCLVWVFAACVSICGLHCSESNEPCVAFSEGGAIEIEGSRNCEACPINAFPTVTTQERTKLVENLQTANAMVGSISSVDSLNERLIFAAQFDHPSFADPPLARLHSLRI